MAAIRRHSERAAARPRRLKQLDLPVRLMGSAWTWAVAGRGEARRARHMLEVVKADIDVALALTGTTSVADIDRSTLYASGSA